MATQDVLSARLEVKDSFTSKLNNFIKSINNADKAFEKFINNADKSARILEKTFDVIDKKVSSVTTKIITQTDSMTNKIVNSSNKVEQAQNKTINNLTSKYGKMGKDVQEIFKVINKDAENLAKSGIKLNLGGGNKNSNNSNNRIFDNIGNVKTDNLMSGILSGSLTRVIGSLSIIGAGVSGVKKVLDTIDGWMQQGFNILNTLSGNLLSYQGIKEGLLEASQFETNRVALDVLYNNNSEVGQKYYQMGTKLAKETPYSESEVGELQKKLAGANVNYDSKQLMTLLDVASVKPELGASHVGFSLVDAMSGRSTSLKTNYMLDNKEVNKYLQSLKKSKNISDRENYKKWKDAFNKTGTVNNKQEYFDLIINYVQKQTSYNGLTEKYSHTISGMIDRLQGNWETLKADLLGIDANGTGKMKPNQITVVSAFNDFMTNLNKWLDDDKTKGMLTDLGSGLGQGVKAITDALSDLLKNVDWKEVGKKLKEMGESIAKIAKDISNSPAFTNFINNLPNLIERILGSKVIDTTTKANQAKEISKGNPVGAGVVGAYGWWMKQLNNLGLVNPEDAIKYSSSSVSNEADSRGFLDNIMYNASQMGNQIKNFGAYLFSPSPDTLLTDANASTILSQNSNITEDQRNQVKDMMKDDNVATYNITIGEIKADNFEQIIDSIQKAQANHK